MQRVRHLRRLASIAKAGRHALGQLQPLVTRFEQHRAAVRAAMRLIELHDQRLIEELRKQDTLLCGTFSHAKASSLVHYALSQERMYPVSYTHLRAHETPEHLVCRLLLEKKK